MNELFEVPQQDSPRLQWLKKHRVHTQRNVGIMAGDECPDTGEPLYPWCAYVGANTFPKPLGLIGHGDTEHEAIVDLATHQGWRLWNEESY